MEKLVLLMYGDLLPPHQHIKRIVDKYIRYYLNDKKKEDFNEDKYVEIRIEERYLGLKQREWYCPLITPIKYGFLPRFKSIFQSFNCGICLCTENHEHPTLGIGDLEYEGYCYYMRDDKKKILFLEDYGKQDDGIEIDALYEKLSNQAISNLNHLDWNNLMPKNERHSVESQEWYRNLPVEQRYKIVNANTETEIAFKQWLNEIVQTGKK